MEHPISILVVEDEPFIAENISNKLKELGYIVAGTVESGEAALKHALRVNPDVVLFDINLAGDLDGIEAARLMQHEMQVVVIYLTSLNDKHTFARARKTEPAAWLEKPFNSRGLKQTIELAMDRQAGGPLPPRHFPESIFLRDSDQHIRLAVADILCIKADRAYCFVITLDGRKFQQSVPMNAMAKRIGSPDLVQIHKSYTLNLTHVTSVAGNTLIANNQEFLLGKKYSAGVKKRLGL